jgi:hypothetical protein
MSKTSALFFIFFGVVLLTNSCSFKYATMSENKTHALRLKPGDDLLKSMLDFAKQKGIKAGWVSTVVGSLTRYQLRMANQSSPTVGEGFFEIVSVTGTFAENGAHLHISISDGTGKTIGGHLLEGCTIYTTAEIVLQSTSDYKFIRENDGTTPYKELQISRTAK